MAELKPLRPRQQRFLDEYLVDLNGSAAVLRSGFKTKYPESTAQKMLAVPSMNAALKERQAAMARRLEITQDNIARELAKIGFASSEDFYDADGNQLPWRLISSRAKAAIKSIIIDETIEASSDPEKPPIVKRRTKFYLHDKRAALNDLAQHLGMYKHHIEIDDKRPSAEQQQLADQARQKFMGMLDQLAGVLAAKAPAVVDQPRALARATNGATNGKGH